LDTENPDPTAVSAEMSSAVERLRSLAAAAFGDPAPRQDDDGECEQQGAGGQDEHDCSDRRDAEQARPHPED